MTDLIELSKNTAILVKEKSEWQSAVTSYKMQLKEVGCVEKDVIYADIARAEERIKSLEIAIRALSRLQDFAGIKSIICDCICNSVVFVNGKIPEEVLNSKGNQYTDKIIQSFFEE